MDYRVQTITPFGQIEIKIVHWDTKNTNYPTITEILEAIKKEFPGVSVSELIIAVQEKSVVLRRKGTMGPF